MTTRPSPLAAALLFAFAASASAAPVELYEQAQSKGMALGLDRANANLADYGFDNKALSVVVRSAGFAVTWRETGPVSAAALALRATA